MKDVFCHKCGAKIGWQTEDARGVTIRCRCEATTIVGPVKKDLPLDRFGSKVAT